MEESQARYTLCLLLSLFFFIPAGWNANLTFESKEWELVARIVLTYYVFCIPFGWLFFKNLEHRLWNWTRKLAGLPPIERMGLRAYFVTEEQTKTERRERFIAEREAKEGERQEENDINYALIVKIVLFPFGMFRRVIRLFLCGLPGMVLFPILTVLHIKEKKNLSP